MRTFLRRRPGRRVLAAALSLAGAVGLAAIAAAPPAPAVAAAPPSSAVAGLRIVEAETPVGSPTWNPLFVRCPEGTHGLSGDVQITGGTVVRIYVIQPAATGVQFVVTEPEQGFAGNWSYKARATCAPTASLPGLEYVWGDARADVLGRGEPVLASAFVQCPSGKGAIGMGARVDATSDTEATHVPATRTHLHAIRAIGVPGSYADTVRAAATSAGFEGGLRVIAFAACVTVRQVPSLRWVEGEHTADNSTADKQARATCPAGTALHGGGFLMNFRVSEQTGAHLGATMVRFGSGLVDVIGRETVAGTPNNWTLFATVLCA